MTLARSARSYLLCTALLAPAAAHAQSAEAEALFRDGRKLIKAGNLDAGCDKLEASERLESSVGTLLNLGDCREKQGRLATAWGAFRKAESLAKLRGQPKRRNEASKRAMALEPKLSNLVIVPSSPITGLVIKRDNDVIDPAMYSSPLPVDPDTYTIVAEAPGYKPWTVEIHVTGHKRRQVVTVPMLEKEVVATTAKPREKLGPTDLPMAQAPPPPVAAPQIVIPERVDRSSEPSMWTTKRKIALGAGIGGAFALGVGVYFGMRSSDLEQRSNDICPSTICDDPEALSLNDRAQDAALRANILYGIGGAALATGVVLWVIGSPDKDERVVRPTVSRDGAGVSIGGKF